MVHLHVGIDTGKKKHHACVHDTVADSYTKNYSFTVSRQGFEGLVGFLERYGTQDEFIIGVEASCPYALTVSYFLLERGYNVVELNPFQASQFRKSQGSKAKTDQIDARSLAGFLAIGSYKPIVLEDPLWENLRELTRFRADLLKDRTRQINRLKESITVSFPELGNHLANLDSPTALALLSSYPGPQSLVEAGVVKIKDSLSQTSRGHFGTVQAQAIFEDAVHTIGLLRREKGLNIKLQVLAQTILALNAQIERIEDEIKEMSGKLPRSPSEIPIGGIQGMAAILAEIGNINRFTTLKKFLSHFGWCPNTFQSGTFSLDHPRMSHAGSPYLRRMIWMLAIRAAQSTPVYRLYFQTRTAAGKKKMHTIVSIGKKILSAIYIVLKTGQPFDTQKEAPAYFAPAKA